MSAGSAEPGTEAPALTLGGLLLRFAAAYVGLALVAGFVLNWLGVRSNPGVNVAVLMASVLWACLAFSNRNRRILAGAEKRRAVLGMIGVDVLLQLALLAAMPPVPSPDASSQWLLNFAGLFVFVLLLHAAAIWWFTGFAGRLYDKQVARTQARVEQRSQ